MTRPHACRLAGLDPDVVAMCAADERRQLAVLAWLYALPPVVCAAACAVIGRVALGSPLAALAFGLAALLATWNIVRLLVASSGMSPQATDAEARAWRPGSHQLLSIGFWVVLQVPVLAAWILLRVGALDEALAEWRILRAQLGSGSPAVAPGLTTLLVLAAQVPGRWLWTTVGLCAVALQPCIYRLVRWRAVASYARRLRGVQRAQILHEWQRHLEAMRALLRPFGRRGTPPLLAEWWADPPFCREPVPPNPAAFDRVRTAADLPLPFDLRGR